jgi:hypothetical protein
VKKTLQGPLRICLIASGTSREASAPGWEKPGISSWVLLTGHHRLPRDTCGPSFLWGWVNHAPLALAFTVLNELSNQSAKQGCRCVSCGFPGEERGELLRLAETEWHKSWAASFLLRVCATCETGTQWGRWRTASSCPLRCLALCAQHPGSSSTLHAPQELLFLSLSDTHTLSLSLSFSHKTVTVRTPACWPFTGCGGACLRSSFFLL